MYTDNQRISRRQVFRLFFFDFLGIGTVILPGLLAQSAQNYGLVSIGIGGVAGLFYLLYLAGCSCVLGSDLQSFLADRERFAKGKRIVAAVLAATSLAGAGFVGAVLSDMVKKSLIREEAYALIWALTLFTAIYAVYSGLETRARVYEILFWFVVVPLLVMLLLAAKGMEVSNFKVSTNVHPQAVLGAAYPVFLVFGSMFALLFLPGRVVFEEKGKITGRTVASVAAAYVLTLAIVFVSYAVLLGNFGSKSLVQMKYPIVTLMSAIRIEGGFFKRLDALMLSVWFFTLFALLCMQLYYGGQMLECACGEAHKKGEHVVAYIIVFVIGLLLGKEAGLWVYADRFFRYIQGPVYVLIPGVCVWMKCRGKRLFRGLLAMCMTISLLVGCASTELEKKSIPLFAAVRAAESGYEILYEPPTQNKVLDYNHIKVIVLETSILEQRALYEKLLEQIAEEETFPRNVYVCAANDVGKLMDMGNVMAEDIGTYIETLLENLAPDARKLPTIGKLMDEFANGGESLWLPYLKPEGAGIIWDGSFGIENAIPVYRILETGENSG